MKMRKLTTIIAVLAAFCVIPTVLFAQNVTQAQIRNLRRDLERGDAEAQYCLGGCYENGEGVTKNYVEAVRLFRKSADQGDADAQYWLGVCYENGWGGAEDYAEAVKWYRKAARQRHYAAQYILKSWGLSW